MDFLFLFLNPSFLIDYKVKISILHFPLWFLELISEPFFIEFFIIFFNLLKVPKLAFFLLQGVFWNWFLNVLECIL